MTCDTAETLLSEEMVRCCGGRGFVAIEVEVCFLFSSMHTRMWSLCLSFYVFVPGWHVRTVQAGDASVMYAQLGDYYRLS